MKPLHYIPTDKINASIRIPQILKVKIPPTSSHHSPPVASVM